MNLVLNLEYNPRLSLSKRLAQALRRAIAEERLLPGDALPSTRDLSVNMKMSRSTVLSALEELVEEGLILSVPGSGYYVEQLAPEKLPAESSKGTESNRGKQFAPLELTDYALRVQQVHEGMKIDWLDKLPEINFGAIPSKLTPHKEWDRMLRRYCRAADIDTLNPTIQPFGYPPLREAVAAYLHRARAVKCTNDQVAIFSTKQLRLELITRILVNPGDHVAFEEPGYAEAKYVMKAHGAIIRPVPTDNAGILIDELFKNPDPVKLIYVTPSHQDPTGPVMPLERRKKLLHWAYRTGTIIIEDDYDCEYRYGQKALPSLQALDEFDNVIYLASLWKSLFMIGFGFAVFPKRLSAIAEMAKMEMERYLPVAEQVALTDLINEGHLEKYLRKSQSKLAMRRQELIFALTRHFKNHLFICAESAGTHLLVRFEKFDDESILAAAKSAKVAIMSTASYYENAPCKGEFILPFAYYEKEEIELRIKRWSDEIERRQAKV